MGTGSDPTAGDRPDGGRAGSGPPLHGLVVGDEPGAWADAGFTVRGGRVTVGPVTVSLVGGARRGVLGWELGPGGDHGDGGDIDGIATSRSAPAGPADRPVVHANGVTGMDHVVVATGDLPRTLGALARCGYRPRRTREVPDAERPRRQVFLWAGDVILEVVGPPQPAPGAGPASVWGLALVVADLDATADLLGADLSKARDAVQPGRRIAAIRTKHFDISVPLALMSPHRPT